MMCRSFPNYGLIFYRAFANLTRRRIFSEVAVPSCPSSTNRVAGRLWASHSVAHQNATEVTVNFSSLRLMRQGRGPSAIRRTALCSASSGIRGLEARQFDHLFTLSDAANPGD